MKYFDDMLSKFGFSDGATQPAGCREYRRVYVQALNTLLDATAAPVRVVAYDRPGLHNGCMILHVTPELFATIAPEAVLSGDGLPPASVTIDEDTALQMEAYQHVLGLIQEMDIDDYVIVEVTVDQDGLGDLLASVMDAEGLSDAYKDTDTPQEPEEAEEAATTDPAEQAWARQAWEQDQDGLAGLAGQPDC